MNNILAAEELYQWLLNYGVDNENWWQIKTSRNKVELYQSIFQPRLEKIKLGWILYLRNQKPIWLPPLAEEKELNLDNHVWLAQILPPPELKNLPGIEKKGNTWTWQVVKNELTPPNTEIAQVPIPSLNSGNIIKAWFKSQELETEEFYNHVIGDEYRNILAQYYQADKFQKIIAQLEDDSWELIQSKKQPARWAWLWPGDVTTQGLNTSGIRIVRWHHHWQAGYDQPLEYLDLNSKYWFSDLDMTEEVYLQWLELSFKIWGRKLNFKLENIKNQAPNIVISTGCKEEVTITAAWFANPYDWWLDLLQQLNLKHV